MKILTVNNYPICASESEILLKKEKEKCINSIKEDNTIIQEEENMIFYHDGIRYVEDIFDIRDINILR